LLSDAGFCPFYGQPSVKEVSKHIIRNKAPSCKEVLGVIQGFSKVVVKKKSQSEIAAPTFEKPCWKELEAC
jgi:hypothetical protein